MFFDVLVPQPWGTILAEGHELSQCLLVILCHWYCGGAGTHFRHSAYDSDLRTTPPVRLALDAH